MVAEPLRRGLPCAGARTRRCTTATELPRWLDGMTYEQLLVTRDRARPGGGALRRSDSRRRRRRPRQRRDLRAVRGADRPARAPRTGGRTTRVTQARRHAVGRVVVPGRQRRHHAARAQEAGSRCDRRRGVRRHSQRRACASRSWTARATRRASASAPRPCGSPTCPTDRSRSIYHQGRQAPSHDRGRRGDGERRLVVAVHRAPTCPDSYREAFKDFVRAPMLVVNVALRRLALHVRAWASPRRAIATGSGSPATSASRWWWATIGRRSHPDKPTILTFYVPFERPGTPINPRAGRCGADRDAGHELPRLRAAGSASS